MVVVTEIEDTLLNLEDIIMADILSSMVKRGMNFTCKTYKLTYFYMEIMWCKENNVIITVLYTFSLYFLCPKLSFVKQQLVVIGPKI